MPITDGTDLLEPARYATKVPKGEIVIVVGPPPEPDAASDDELRNAVIYMISAPDRRAGQAR